MEPEYRPSVILPEEAGPEVRKRMAWLSGRRLRLEARLGSARYVREYLEEERYNLPVSQDVLDAIATVCVHLAAHIELVNGDIYSLTHGRKS